MLIIQAMVLKAEVGRGTGRTQYNMSTMRMLIISLLLNSSVLTVFGVLPTASAVVLRWSALVGNLRSYGKKKHVVFTPSNGNESELLRKGIDWKMNMLYENTKDISYFGLSISLDLRLSIFVDAFALSLLSSDGVSWHFLLPLRVEDEGSRSCEDAVEDVDWTGLGGLL